MEQGELAGSLANANQDQGAKANDVDGTFDMLNPNSFIHKTALASIQGDSEKLLKFGMAVEASKHNGAQVGVSHVGKRDRNGARFPPEFSAKACELGALVRDDAHTIDVLVDHKEIVDGGNLS